MQYGAIDLHRRSSVICLAGPADGSYEEQSVATSRAGLTAFFAGRARCRILIESSTESEWVARLLEELGHEVVVGAPGYELMYATRSRLIKTDKRDGRALCDACRLGHYRKAHRTDEPWRSVRKELSVRDALVRSRTRMINVARSLCRQEGCVIGPGDADTFAARAAGTQLPAALKQTLAPLLRCIKLLSGRIGRCDAKLKALAGKHERVRRLMTVPGVGQITALAFAAVVEPASRFSSAAQVASYLGLVPREDTSSDKRRLGRITKCGDRRVRWLLVEASHRVMRSKGAQAADLRKWSARVLKRRGRGPAVVGLARKLSGRMWLIDIQERDYELRAN
jgi:transposase